MSATPHWNCWTWWWWRSTFNSQKYRLFFLQFACKDSLSHMQQWWYMRINLSKLQKLVLSSSHSLSVDVHKFGLFITAMAKMKFQLRFWQIYMYKVTTTRTLMRRAQLVCDLHSRLQNGTAYLNHLFKAKTTTTQTLLDGKPTVTPIPTLVNSAPVTTVTIPYIRATYEPIVSYTYNLTTYTLHTNW